MSIPKSKGKYTDERYYEKAKGRITNSLLIDLSYMITVAEEEGVDNDVLAQWIDNRLLLRNRCNTDLEELDKIQNGIRKLYDAVVEVVNDRKLSIKKSGLAINFKQPKYKVSDAAQILGIERATLNNWTNRLGGFIRSFEHEGHAKFILEEDLIRRYYQLHGQDLSITKELREKHQYIIKF